MQKGGYVYIITNYHNKVLYVGVTSNIQNRIWEHQNHTFKDSFSSKYKLNKLVYFEGFSDIEEAINREKFLKGKTRKFKNALIEENNPDWKELTQEIEFLDR